MLHLSLEQFSRRYVRLDGVTHHFQQEPERVQYGVVVIDYGYLSAFGLGQHCLPEVEVGKPARKLST